MLCCTSIFVSAAGCSELIEPAAYRFSCGTERKSTMCHPLAGHTCLPSHGMANSASIDCMVSSSVTDTFRHRDPAGSHIPSSSTNDCLLAETTLEHLFLVTESWWLSEAAVWSFTGNDRMSAHEIRAAAKLERAFHIPVRFSRSMYFKTFV